MTFAARLEPTAALGTVLPAVVDIVSANVTLSAPLGARVLHAVWNLSLFVALGLGIDLLYAVVRGLTRGSAWRFLVVEWLTGSILVFALVERNLRRQAEVAFDDRFSTPLVIALAIAAGSSVPACRLLGTWLGRRRRLFLAGVVLALAGAIVNVCVLRDDYIELHATAALACALVAGPSLRPTVLRLASRWRPGRVRRASAAGLVAAAVVAAIPPPNAVRLALFESPGCSGVWVAALHLWPVPLLSGPTDPSIEARWLTQRTGTRPPSGERLTAGPPVVVLVTIDAVRADVLADPARTAEWPTFKRLLREGAVFRRARSPGSQTSVSLTALFSGKHFSELRWSWFGEGRSRFQYAVTDPTPRLPQVLTDAGVSTYKAVSLIFLKNEFGVAPGFSEEDVVTQGRRHATAREVVTPLAARIRSVKKDEAFFGFAHLTEPHAPYDRGKLKQGEPFERYVSEIGATDHHLGDIVRALSAPGVAGRSILILTADHGEAFGEHGTYHHTKTIYEELVRVPLVVWGSKVEARTIDEPVTLVDLHPTVLDIFGLDADDDTAGQSLVPLLYGGDVAPTRPIIAEGRLRRALYAGDLKVIVDLRRATVEAFDLAADPGELHNLFDSQPERVAPLLATLGAYFDARAFRAPGYETPYKP